MLLTVYASTCTILQGVLCALCEFVMKEIEAKLPVNATEVCISHYACTSM